MERKKREIILSTLLVIFIATTMYFFVTNYSKETIVGKGKIVGQPTMIGAVQTSKETIDWWFSFPVDTNGDGQADLIVLDTSQSSDFGNGFQIGWTVTYQKRDGKALASWLPFLWESVLDSSLPSEQQQSVYLAINYSN